GTVSQIIVTGGVGMGDTISEAQASREYLLANGVAAQAILSEETGTTTLESLRNAAELVRANGMERVLLVSDAYHMLRALKIARDLGLDAVAAPVRAPDAPLSAEYAAHIVRETGAYLVYVFARQ
ncbi:MAG: YdcF family protein, partial [Roseiflexaceae bacterium]|nr:YdcF family protein [Roseiflexaceae bacterium]